MDNNDDDPLAKLGEGLGGRHPIIPNKDARPIVKRTVLPISVKEAKKVVEGTLVVERHRDPFAGKAQGPDRSLGMIEAAFNKAQKPLDEGEDYWKTQRARQDLEQMIKEGRSFGYMVHVMKKTWKWKNQKTLNQITYFLRKYTPQLTRQEHKSQIYTMALNVYEQAMATHDFSGAARALRTMLAVVNTFKAVIPQEDRKDRKVKVTDPNNPAFGVKIEGLDTSGGFFLEGDEPDDGILLPIDEDKEGVFDDEDEPFFKED